jgi:folate-dependent phosphoribosylglycinamide formyltransferase PurN
MLSRPPLRVAVLCSQRAPGVRHLLECVADGDRDWTIVCCLTSEETFAEHDEVDYHGVAIVRHPVRRFYAGYDPAAPACDLRVREAYDWRTVQLLEPYEPDVILLAGYLLVLTRPMLDPFAPRILNVHHSDLALRDRSGGPRYPGLRAVRDAILAGERETRSSVHVVTERVDQGPLLLRSPAYPVADVAVWARAAGEVDVVKRAIWVHQEWMLRTAFGPLMEAALDRLAALGHDAASWPQSGVLS